MKICACGSLAIKDLNVYKTSWGPITIATCARCGLARDIDDYEFKEYHRSTLLGADVDIVAWSNSQAIPESTRKYFELISRLVRKKGRVLEIGCATGKLLEYFKKDGWLTFGMDPNVDFLTIASMGGHNVIAGYFPETEIKERDFDTIIISHTLEHIPALSNALAETYRLLRPGGYLFIVVPNFGSISGKLIHSLHGGCLIFIPKQHVWFFTKTSLGRMCASMGFELVTGGTKKGKTAWSHIPFLKKIPHAGITLWKNMFDDGEELLSLFKKPG
jgi:2-polyprenyl-3-methyl-5-hydroxy-6-metoxy-1,4-benzoquinol methylase